MKKGTEYVYIGSESLTWDIGETYTLCRDYIEGSRYQIFSKHSNVPVFVDKDKFHNNFKLKNNQ